MAVAFLFSCAFFIFTIGPKARVAVLSTLSVSLTIVMLCSTYDTLPPRWLVVDLATADAATEDAVSDSADYTLSVNVGFVLVAVRWMWASTALWIRELSIRCRCGGWAYKWNCGVPDFSLLQLSPQVLVEQGSPVESCLGRVPVNCRCFVGQNQYSCQSQKKLTSPVTPRMLFWPHTWSHKSSGSRELISSNAGTRRRLMGSISPCAETHGLSLGVGFLFLTCMCNKNPRAQRRGWHRCSDRHVCIPNFEGSFVIEPARLHLGIFSG